MKDADHILHSTAVQINNSYKIHIIRRGIATMSKFQLLVAAALTLAPAIAMAKVPALEGYMLFTLTDTELAQMPNSADKACLAKVDEEPFAAIACTAPQFDRFEQRLNQSYQAAMAMLPKAKKTNLESEQGLWLITREAVCKARVGDELNEMSVAYNTAVIQCALAELYRRTLWVERYR
jgi:uncharacterized protein YecT (DUF1311 family)